MATRDFGVYVPTTDIFDVTYIQQLDVNSPEFKELIVRLQQRTNQIALALNTKETGMYSLNEFLTSQVFFPDPLLSSTTAATPIYRQTYRKVIQCGALPNAGQVTIAHDIPVDGTYTFTRIYGVANDYTSRTYIPLPFSSPTLNENVKLLATDQDVVLETAIDLSSYTNTLVILEYFIS